MTIIFFLIPLSIIIACVFLCAFIWAVRSGQYEDTYTPSMRALMDNEMKSAVPENLKSINEKAHQS